jgi:hypothetical protein
MRKRTKSDNFNWSKTPSKENVHSVYIASANSYVDFNRGITKDEFVQSLNTYVEIQDLIAKKEAFKSGLLFTIMSIPFIILFYNVFLQYLESLAK